MGTVNYNNTQPCIKYYHEHLKKTTVCLCYIQNNDVFKAKFHVDESEGQA